MAQSAKPDAEPASVAGLKSSFTPTQLYASLGLGKAALSPPDETTRICKKALQLTRRRRSVEMQQAFLILPSQPATLGQAIDDWSLDFPRGSHVG